MAQHGTASSPLFLTNAVDLVTRLAQLNGPVAASLAQEARVLATIFRSWETARPTDEDRVAAIQRLFDLHRRAMDFVSKVEAPSSHVRPTTARDDDDEDDDEGPRPLAIPHGKGRD